MSNNKQKIWIPHILMPELYINNCNERFWGFDERVDHSGKKAVGFFFDIETYDEQNVTTILCPCPVHAVRWTDETGRVNDGRRDNQPNLPMAFVYRIENSDFSEWLTDQSGGIFTNTRHYELITCDDVIDILTYEEPVLFQ